MALTVCPQCEREIRDKTWGCPHCGGVRVHAKTGKEISMKGMTVLIVVFVLFPVLLFLLHIFVPNL